MMPDELRKPQKIGVFGIGAIGTVIAYHLGVDPIHELSYFNRSERNTLRLVLPDQQQRVRNISCSADLRTSGLDWLFICLKAHQIAEAIPQILPLVGFHTQIVVIRNGLNFREDWTEAGLAELVLPVLIDCPTQLNTEGYYEQLKTARLTAPDSTAGHLLAKLTDPTSLAVTLTTDFKTASWLKLTESAALGAITCLTGEGCWVFENNRILTFYQSLLEEITTVALADGAIIPPDFITELLAKVKQYPRHKTSSMWADRLAGKPIELGAKNGIIAELARKYGIVTPLNDLVCALLGVINNSPID